MGESCGGSSPLFGTNIKIARGSANFRAGRRIDPHLPIIRALPDAGWSSLVARRAHNPKVVGSNPAPATNDLRSPFLGAFCAGLERARSFGAFRMGVAHFLFVESHRCGTGGSDTDDWWMTKKRTSSSKRLLAPDRRGAGAARLGHRVSRCKAAFGAADLHRSRRGRDRSTTAKPSSKQVSDVLDVEEALPSSYTLEVSSPGMDRLLFKPEQYAESIGETVDVRLNYPFEGRRRVVGALTGLAERRDGRSGRG